MTHDRQISAARKAALLGPEQAPLGLFAPATFEADSLRFSCLAQYVAFRKALLFYDDERAYDVLKAAGRGAVETAERQIKNFDAATWSKHYEAVLFDGLRALIAERPETKSELAKLVGASVTYADRADGCMGTGTGQGQNLYGKFLSKAAADLA